MPGARPARGWVLVSACACLIAAGAACGSAFTADAVDGGSGGGDAGLDVARDAAPSGDAPVDGPGPGEGGGSDGQPVDDGGTDGHDGGTCGKADAGYEQCIYLHCECLYPGGANAFYAKEWACTCASASTCEPQCMPTTCGNG